MNEYNEKKKKNHNTEYWAECIYNKAIEKKN